MSSESIIRLRGAGKCYNLYDKPSDRLKQALANRLPGNGRKQFYREHWALRGINLEIAHGETVGIIGQNGSGKSTLLQLICGTLAPTEGEVWIKGRIAPLLQLGAGFNPEFTGRENVALNAAILGLTTEEIDARFDEIVAFANIGEMLERPVKLYSSGMYARLAFAVAINVDPEILIVDEALAVGDEGFQRKCYGRIEAIRRAGATILFVSHASNTVAQLCNRAYLLDQGQLISHGHPRPVIQRHNQLNYALASDRESLRNKIKAEMSRIGALATDAKSIDDGTDSSAHSHMASPESHPDGERAKQPTDDIESFFDSALQQSARPQAFPENGAKILSQHVETADNKRVNTLKPDEIYQIVMHVRFVRRIDIVRFSWTLRTTSGLVLAGASTHAAGSGFDGFDADEVVIVRFPFRNIFNPGVLTIDLGVRGFVNEPDEFAHGIAEALVVRASDRKVYRHGFVDCCLGSHFRIERRLASPAA